jgi:hypothetical protein
VTVHIFVEGGGPQKRTQTECRKAFRIFFEKALGEMARPRISACGSRVEAYRDFCRSLRNDRDTVAILLVDSEEPVIAGQTPREHLRNRDGWTEPLTEGHVHLMVQCMESWFLADRSALKTYYGAQFRPNRLPANERIEAIPKRDVMRGLAGATKDTGKGQYHKTRHGFAILESIDPAMVRSHSGHAKEFLDFLFLVCKPPVGLLP